MGVGVGVDDLDLYFERLESIVLRLARRLVHDGSRYLPDDLTPAQFMLLKLVGDGRTTTSAVSEAFGVTPSAVTWLGDRLCAAGLMRRDRDEADRRVVWLELTSEGAARLAELEGSRRALAREYLHQLSPEDRELILRGLERLTSVVCGPS